MRGKVARALRRLAQFNTNKYKLVPDQYIDVPTKGILTGRKILNKDGIEDDEVVVRFQRQLKEPTKPLYRVYKRLWNEKKFAKKEES